MAWAILPEINSPQNSMDILRNPHHFVHSNRSDSHIKYFVTVRIFKHLQDRNHSMFQ